MVLRLVPVVQWSMSPFFSLVPQIFGKKKCTLARRATTAKIINETEATCNIKSLHPQHQVRPWSCSLWYMLFRCSSRSFRHLLQSKEDSLQLLYQFMHLSFSLASKISLARWTYFARSREKGLSITLRQHFKYFAQAADRCTMVNNCRINIVEFKFWGRRAA